MSHEPTVFQDSARHIRALLKKKVVDAADMLKAAELMREVIRTEEGDPRGLAQLVREVAQASLTLKNPEGHPIDTPRTAFWLAHELANRHSGTEKTATQLALNVTHAILSAQDAPSNGTLLGAPGGLSDRLYAHEIAGQIQKWAPEGSQAFRYAARILAWDPEAKNAVDSSPLAQDQEEAKIHEGAHSLPHQNKASSRLLKLSR